MKIPFLFLLLLITCIACEQPVPIQGESTNNEIPDSLYKQHFHRLETLYVLEHSHKLQMKRDEQSGVFSKSMIAAIQINARIYELPSTKKKYGNKAYDPQLLKDSLAYVKAYAIEPDMLGGDALRNRVTNGVYIPMSEYEEFMGILNDPKSYNTSVAACFEPKIGLVMYDRTNVPLGHISVCLDCNQLYATMPTAKPNTARKGLSKEARMKMRQLFFRWSFDYYGYAAYLDDSVAYQQYLAQ